MSDHYYERELNEFRRTGTLHHLDVAFSRDQHVKVYVQDLMRERGARLFAWLEAGAHLYVCGDKQRMATDVDRTLHEVVARHGGLSTAAAAEYVRQLASNGRYARDVY